MMNTKNAKVKFQRQFAMILRNGLLQEMVHKVTDDLLLKIDKLEENNKSVQNEIEQIVANCNLLSQLDLEIRALGATVTSLQKEIGNVER